MTEQNVGSNAGQIKIDRLRATHVGAVKIGNIEIGCAVLEGGRRGYVQRSLRQAVGLRWNIPVPTFLAFLGKIAPNALKFMNESGSGFEIVMPHGGTAKWVEAGVLTEIASGILDAALDGKLAKNQLHMIAPCRAIVKALARTGEVGLIDEATGYQYSRAPDALQDLFARLISQSASDWERRFHPEYYSALCKLIGQKYEGTHKPLPNVIGAITLKWVYEAIFPPEIIVEIRSRQNSEKLHQWLTREGGLPLLERQRDAVMMIARSSVDYKDFDARCSVAFYRPNQQLGMMFPQATQIGGGA